MMHKIANSTGFTVMQHTLDDFSEVLHKALRSPVEDTANARTGFNLETSKKERRIKDMVRKANIAYTVDGIIRQSVDKYAELFKAFDFDGGEEQVKYLKERFVAMTLQTGEHWQTLLTRIVTEYFKTGNVFIVKRRGGNAIAGKRPLYRNKPFSISGLSLVSCDRLDTFRNDDGEFVGWEIHGTKNDDRVRLILPGALKLPEDQALVQVMNRPPNKSNVLMPGMDIVQIAYKKPADSYWGFGMTLAAIEDISMVRTLEQVTAIMIKKFSNPIIHHKVLRPSSPQQGMQQEINMAYDLWRRMAPDGVLITGGNAEIKAIGSESQALRNEGYLKYYLYRGLASLGTSPYILGLEGGGQGTLEASMELMMMRVRFCQEEISRELEMFLFNELLWEGGFDPYTNPEHRVKLVFEDIDEDRLIKLQTHAADMFQKNMWGHEEARQKARTKGPADEQDLHIHKIDIPKAKAEAEAKGQANKDAGVAIAKAKPKPAAAKKPAKKKSKEVLAEITNLIPENEEQLNLFLNIMENRFGYDADKLDEVSPLISNLFGDEEAIKILLVERLSDEG